MAESTTTEPEMTMAKVDSTFQQLDCLGHGGFGSVFLAKKRSGRKVALKFMRIGLDDDEDEIHASFTREVDAVLKLDCTEGNKDMSIVYIRDWFRGPNFACIVMDYSDGGTLAQEIESREQPYPERRIVWYALQLSEALAHAHSRGVTHHDVKSSNVLIDRSAGGKLLLADFGSAVSPGEEGQTFTKLFAAPELQLAYDRDDFTGLDPQRIDAFAMGCILFELVCCKRMVDFAGEATLGQFVSDQQRAEAALNLPDVRLPWLPPTEARAPSNTDRVGYSSELGHLVKSLLEPQTSARYAPKDLVKPLRQGDRSPLLADFCSAALSPVPGSPISVDNIQLGMFVQRGRDWNDGDADGGHGSIGVVVKLDPDAHYTEVAFPSRSDSIPPKTICCRIGAGNKYELQVGPTPMNDFIEGTAKQRLGGLIFSEDTSKYRVGQKINNNCMIVSIDNCKSIIFMAPMETISIPSQEISIPIVPVLSSVNPRRRPMPVPITWNPDLGLLVPLESQSGERQVVLDSFFSPEGGMDIQTHEVLTIHAVQSQPLWETYSTCCEEIAAKNWSNPNQQRLFHGTGGQAPENLLTSPDTFYQVCAAVTPSVDGQNEIVFSSAASFGDRFGYRSADGSAKKMVLSRVALGRVDNSPSQPPFPVDYHSSHKQCPYRGTVISISNPFQAYPEFIITYKVLQRPGRRTVRARRPSESPREGNNRNRSRPVPARPPQMPSPAMANNNSMPASFFADPPGTRAGQFAAAAKAKSPKPPPVPAAARTPPTAQANEEKNTPGSKAKSCVVCWERPVSTVLIPCGHPCLCEVCSTQQGLRKIKMKCPECRTRISQAVKIWAKVVED